MSKPRLAYFGVVHFPAKGGVSRMTEGLISQLKDEFEITIYCVPHPLARNCIEGVKAIQVPCPRIGSIGVFIHFVLCLFHAWFLGRYDIVHIKKIDAAIFLPLLHFKFKKILATSHESPYLRDKWGWIARRYFKFCERVFIKSNVKLSVISKTLSEDYYNRYGKLVEYIPNGVQLDVDYKSSRADEILSEKELGHNYIMFAARRIMATKGLHTMLQALKRINYSGQIVVAGEDDHADEYMKMIKRLSEGLHVINIGFIKDRSTLLDLVTRSGLFVFPSEVEGMSIMLLEVAQLGVPVIASDIPENASVFDQKEMIFFKSKNSESLAIALSEYFLDPESGRRRAERAKTRVHKEYSLAAMSQHYRKLYKML